MCGDPAPVVPQLEDPGTFFYLSKPQLPLPKSKGLFCLVCVHVCTHVCDYAHVCTYRGHRRVLCVLLYHSELFPDSEAHFFFFN